MTTTASSRIVSCLLILCCQAYAGLLPKQDWNTFTFPERYNGSSRASFPAGSTMNITWTPGGSNGPSGLISILLLGGILNTTLSPEIASGIDSSLGTYSWRIPTVLSQFAYYDLEILSESNTAYYSQAVAQFEISGLNPSSSSSLASSTSSIASTTSIPLPVTISSSTPSATQGASSSTELSIGAKAGIGVGAGIAALGAFVVLGIYIFRRGRRAKTSPMTNDEDSNEKKDELTVGERSELEDIKRMAELEGLNAPQEMSAGTREELEAWRRWRDTAEME